MQFTLIAFGENHLIFKFALSVLLFLFREILPCSKPVVRKESSSLTTAALMRKTSGKKSTLRSHRNPKGGPGEGVCSGGHSAQCRQLVRGGACVLSLADAHS